jgi:hypothetical protein
MRRLGDERYAAQGGGMGALTEHHRPGYRVDLVERPVIPAAP